MSKLTKFLTLLAILLQFLWNSSSPFRQLYLFKLNDAISTTDISLPRGSYASTATNVSFSTISKTEMQTDIAAASATWELFRKSGSVKLLWSSLPVAELSFTNSSKLSMTHAESGTTSPAILEAVANLFNIPHDIHFDITWDIEVLVAQFIVYLRRLGFAAALDGPLVVSQIPGDIVKGKDWVRGLKYESTFADLQKEIERLKVLTAIMSDPANSNRFWNASTSAYGAPLLTRRMYQTLKGKEVDQTSMIRSTQGYSMLMGIKYRNVTRAWDGDVDELARRQSSAERVAYLLSRNGFMNALLWDVMTGCGVEVGSLSLQVEGGRRLGDSFDKQAHLVPNLIVDPFCQSESWAGPEVVLSAVGYDEEYCNPSFNGEQYCQNASLLTEWVRNDWSYLGGVAEGSYISGLLGLQRRQLLWHVDAPAQVLQYRHDVAEDRYKDIFTLLWDRGSHNSERNVLDPGCAAVYQSSMRENAFSSLLQLALEDESTLGVYVESGCTRDAVGGLSQVTSPGHYHLNKHNGCSWVGAPQNWSMPLSEFIDEWIPHVYYEVYILNGTNASQSVIFRDWEVGNGHVSTGSLVTFYGLEAWKDACMLGIRFKGLGLTRIYKAAVLGDTSVGIISRTQKSWILGGHLEDGKLTLKTNALRGKFNTVLYFSIFLSLVTWLRMIVCYLERFRLLWSLHKDDHIRVERFLLMSLDVRYDTLVAGGITAKTIQGLPSLLTVANNLRAFAAIAGLNVEREWHILSAYSTTSGGGSGANINTTTGADSSEWTVFVTLLAMWGVLGCIHIGKVRIVSWKAYISRFRVPIPRFFSAVVCVLSATGTIAVLINSPLAGLIDLDLFAVVLALLTDALLNAAANPLRSISSSRSFPAGGSIHRLLECRHISPPMYGEDIMEPASRETNGSTGIHYCYLVSMCGIELSSHDLAIKGGEIWDYDQKEVADAKVSSSARRGDHKPDAVERLSTGANALKALFRINSKRMNNDQKAPRNASSLQDDSSLRNPSMDITVEREVDRSEEVVATGRSESTTTSVSEEGKPLVRSLTNRKRGYIY